jgi:2-oxoisovalerate dehydrogenase E1 component
MRARGQGHYTIGSAGHESNALVAAALRPTDPALLHYRSGAFYLARVLQDGRPLADGVRDVLLSMMGAIDDPASGGRHKVFGHPELAIIPQTSTIASHLPRAVGVAFAIDRARRINVDTRWPTDAVTVTSFGDASLNHSTAVGALNTAGYCVTQGLDLPLLFVCEDNGIGISVPTPTDWISQAARRPGVRYEYVDGASPAEVAGVATELVGWIRRTRRPGLLHLRTVRFLGHAGTDVESTYRSPASIRADYARDPLLGLAAAYGAGAADRYDEIGRLVEKTANDLQARRGLGSAAEVMRPLALRVADGASRQSTDPSVRAAVSRPGLTLAQSINAALVDALETRPNALVFGEDIGRKGGVYGVTRGLSQRFRTARVFDTLLDEQAILGLGLGAGVSGLLPIPEIQYLAYLHNAEDQLRGEGASLSFFSNGTYTNPMVVRVAGLAYQKGFGGHFHNDNAVAVLRDVPGLVVAVPAHPDDAPALLQSCLDAAVRFGQVSVFLEPIALYHERDLHEPGDDGWLSSSVPSGPASIGTGRTHGDGRDLTIVTFGNGVRMSRRVGARLAADGIGVRVLDLRWISPLPVEDILREARVTGRVLVADETRHSGGVGEGVVTALVEHAFDGRIARVASADSFIPLGPAADLVLLTEAQIETAARSLVRPA